MPRLMQINVSANWGSHGRIAEDIGQLMMSKGWESYIAYGRYANPSQSRLIKIGNKWDHYMHGLQSRLFDNHGQASKQATQRLIEEIAHISPDIIHLHNIHGYYLNYPILFSYLASGSIPVVWTLHDCWPITGHCAYFTYEHCEKWKESCVNCCYKNNYPKSLLFQHSASNYVSKRNHFTQCKNMTIVPVSHWLEDIVSHTFLAQYRIKMIHNGIDIKIFSPQKKSAIIDNMFHKKHEYIVLGVSNDWRLRKGFRDFLQLREMLDDRFLIVLIGLPRKLINSLPDGVMGIERTNSINELAEYYSSATVFVNPTYEDNFPTTNLEALACGTPVITYETGGSPEAIKEGETGFVIPYGDCRALAMKIVEAAENGKFEQMKNNCRNRAELLYNKMDRYQEYLELYDSLLH